MNDLQIFKSNEFGEVRTFKESDGSITFCATDVAKALGYGTNPQDAIRRHCKEDGCVNHAVIDSMGRTQQAKFITKGNLVRLAASSQLPGAAKFESWIFDEVIPSVLEHGAYATPDTLDKMISSPEFGIKLLTELKKEQEQRKALESENAQQKQVIAEFSPKASYYDVVLQTKDTLSASQIAKDYGKSAQWLNETLHDKGVQYKQGDVWLLYQKHAQQGYTKSKTHTYSGNDGRQHSKLHTYWTQKGRLFIYDLLKKDGIYPLIEQKKSA